MDLWTAIASIPGIGPALPYLAAVVGICVALSTALPPGTAGTPYARARTIIRWIGGNFGHATKANLAGAKP